MKVVGVRVQPLSVLRSYHTIVAAPERSIPPADAPSTGSSFALVELQTDNGLVGPGEVSDYEPDQLAIGGLGRITIRTRICRHSLPINPRPENLF